MAEYIYRAEPIGEGEYSHTLVGELVRCGECKHNSLNRMSGNAFCEWGHAFSQLYDYCSDGERRADDETD